jgi:hypothetical protein
MQYLGASRFAPFGKLFYGDRTKDGQAHGTWHLAQILTELQSTKLTEETV